MIVSLKHSCVEFSTFFQNVVESQDVFSLILSMLAVLLHLGALFAKQLNSIALEKVNHDSIIECRNDGSSELR